MVIPVPSSSIRNQMFPSLSFHSQKSIRDFSGVKSGSIFPRSNVASIAFWSNSLTKTSRLSYKFSPVSNSKIFVWSIVMQKSPLIYPSDSISLRKIYLGNGKFCCQLLWQCFCNFAQFPSSSSTQSKKFRTACSTLGLVQRALYGKASVVGDVG